MVILQTIFCPTDLQFLAPTSLGSFTNMMLLPFIRYLSVVALKEIINVPQSMSEIVCEFSINWF